MRVENSEYLVGIGLGVLLDLFTREWLASFRTSGGIPDHCSEITDEENHHMTQLLKLPQFIEHNGVAEMEVRRGRVSAKFNP